jgi:hypothetical protein
VTYVDSPRANTRPCNILSSRGIRPTFGALRASRLVALIFHKRLLPRYNLIIMTMTQPSSTDNQQTILYSFGKFMCESIPTNPIRTFLVLVFIYMLSMVATSWLMVRWLASGNSDKVMPQKQCPSCGSADTMKAGSNDPTSRSWNEKE